MKNVTILAATEGEIQGLQAWWDQLPVRDRPAYDLTFRVGGIGAVSAAVSTYAAISQDHPDILLWIGIAGAFDRSLTIGQVVEVKQDQLVDLQIEHADGHLTDLDHLLEQDTLASTSLLEPNAELDLGIARVKSITAQKVSGAQSTIDDLCRRYHPQIEQMEGAAFFFVCLKQGIACLQIRAISNYVEPRDRDLWQPALAIDHLHAVIRGLLQTRRFDALVVD